MYIFANFFLRRRLISNKCFGEGELVTEQMLQPSFKEHHLFAYTIDSQGKPRVSSEYQRRFLL